jgi:hypothetical protein
MKDGSVKTKAQPLWLFGGSPDDDSHFYDERRKCLGQGAIYYSYEPENLAHARNLCAACPVYRQCVRYGLAHYDDIPNGIMFGLTEMQRRRISEGRDEFHDWRREWSRAKYAAAITRAYDRRQQRQGKSKRAENRREIPPCPYGHEGVRRAGLEDDRQLYRCKECGATFIGEELGCRTSSTSTGTRASMTSRSATTASR